MQKPENRLKKSGKQKGEYQYGEERPKKSAKQQERDKEKQQKIAKDKRAEGFFGLGFRL